MTQGTSKPSPLHELIFWYRIYTNIVDGLSELRRSSTALLEVTLGVCAIASGFWIGWPFYRPYNSEVFRALTDGAPAWVWGAVWVAQGAYQGALAYFYRREDAPRNKAARRQAAAVGAMLWVFVAWVLLFDHAPGWMTAIAPVFAIAEVVTFTMLLHRRRSTDS